MDFSEVYQLVVVIYYVDNLESRGSTPSRAKTSWLQLDLMISISFHVQLNINVFVIQLN